MSLKQPVRIFINSNTDVAPFLRQEFVRIRPNREGDREAVVAGRCQWYFKITTRICWTVNNIVTCCSASSADSDLSGSRDVVHSDEEAGTQTAYPTGFDGP